MKSSIGIFALGLAAGVAAHEHAHEKFHQMRAVASASCNVTYVTSTSYGEWKLVPETSTSSSVAPTSSSKAAPPPPPPTSSATPSSSSVAPPPPPPSSTSSVAPPPPPPSTSSSSTAPPPPPPSTYSAPPPPPTTSATWVQNNNNNNPVAAVTSAVGAMLGGVMGGSKSGSSGSSGSISTNGNQWAFCYTPYASDGSCKDAGTVSSDIASLKGKGFTTIRTYANDCSGVPNIASACQANGMKMVLGIDLSKGKPSDSDLANYMSPVKGNWGMVEMVVVGNEAIFGGQISAGDMASYIPHVKSQFQGAGYNGPVTTTEPLGTIQQYGSTLCPVVDVIAANIHPFFNGGIAALGAGAFVASQLGDLGNVCNNQKPAYCLETGWPNGGGDNGAAIPGVSLQKTAVEGIMAAAGSKVAMFSFQDDTWKAPGQWGVEQNWGSAQLFG